MGKIKRIIVHCTAEYVNSRRNKEYYRHLFFDIKGWKHYGYHAVVYQDGTWEVLQPLPAAKGAASVITNVTMAVGAKDFNSSSLQIAYVGGITKPNDKPADTRTDAQKQTLWAIIACWKKDYCVTEVVGHRDLPGVNKACPCFDAITTYRNA